MLCGSENKRTNKPEYQNKFSVNDLFLKVNGDSQNKKTFYIPEPTENKTIVPTKNQ